MSFTISFVVDSEGNVEDVRTGGKPPTGAYTVNGHAHNATDGDWSQNSIGVVAPFAAVSGSAQASPVVPAE